MAEFSDTHFGWTVWWEVRRLNISDTEFLARVGKEMPGKERFSSRQLTRIYDNREPTSQRPTLTAIARVIGKPLDELIEQSRKIPVKRPEKKETWTRSRREGLIHLPADLVESLIPFKKGASLTDLTVSILRDWLARKSEPGASDPSPPQPSGLMTVLDEGGETTVELTRMVGDPEEHEPAPDELAKPGRRIPRKIPKGGSRPRRGHA